MIEWFMYGILIAILITFILLYVFQRRLIYIPNFPSGSRKHVWRPDRFNLAYEYVTIESADSTKTTGYYIPATDPACSLTVIFFQANAGNIGHRLPIIAKIRSLIDCNVFMQSYRGYGESRGSPDEFGIKLDVQAGLEWVKKKVGDECKLVAYGQSIGGAVAIDLVARNPKVFHGLIVENTFTSLPDLVPHVLPWLRPFTFLLHQRWASLEKIKALALTDLKVLLLSGAADKLVPSGHSKLLYEAMKKEDIDCELKAFKNGDHNNTVVQKGYFDAVTDFLQQFSD